MDSLVPGGSDPSPAIQALQENLSAAGGDGGSTAKQRKPWFGSLRGAVQKGALQAKAAVDLLRAERPKLEQANADEPKTEPRQSSDSAVSSQKGDEKSAHQSPKGAKGSLRRTFRNSQVNRHRKRHSVFSVTARSSSELSRPTSGANRNSPYQVDEGEEGSKRKSSFAHSLVGSIRGIRRHNDVAPYPPAATETSKLRDGDAETVPLPSSPINIPSAVPALHLDLGPPGFLLDYPTASTQVTETLKLTDLANIITARPDSRYPLQPPASPASTRPTSPAQLLHLRMSPLDDPMIVPPGPPTPMPGTNLPLELDGASSSEQSDLPAMMERSVTPAAAKECKRLRSMHSLDAMAEACAVAHALDEPPAVDADDTKSCQGECSSEKHSTELMRSSPLPLQLSMSELTLAACPSDMEDLSRQNTAQPVVHQTAESGGEEPSSSKHHLGTGPPSPARSVILPFRPKHAPGAGYVDAESHVNSRISVDCDIHLLSSSDTAGTNSPISPDQSLTMQLEFQRSDAWTQSVVDQPDVLLQETRYLAVVEEEKQISIDQQESSVQNQASRDSEMVFPNYNDTDCSGSNGLSPRGGPLVPLSYAATSSSTESTPPKTLPSHTNRTTTTDNAFRFHFDKWIKDASTPTKSPNDPDTPRQRATDSRVDSFSTAEEERITPPISPQLSTPTRTPTMGDRLEFDLERSKRNMRYNALFQRPGAHGDGGVDEPDRPRLAFGYFFDGSIDLDANALQAVDVDNAYASSPSRFGVLKQSSTADDEAQDEAQSDKASSKASNARGCASRGDDVPDDWHDPFSAPPSTPVDVGAFKILDAPPKVDIEDFSLPNRQEYNQSDISKTKASPSSPRSTGLTVMDPLGPPGNDHTRSAIPPPIFDSPQVKASSRVTSTDTLDSSLDLFVSPDKAQPEEGSQTELLTKTSNKAPLPSHYRSLNKRNRITPSIGMPSRHV